MVSEMFENLLQIEAIKIFNAYLSWGRFYGDN